tara:strand:- start:82 stop:282 length:201 start_codon:yes stop_codon:yes gene_type:complete
MSFLITHIDVHESLDEDIQFKIDNGLGLWSSKEHEIWDDVEKYIQPYNLKSLEYESNRPHALTSFM